MASRHEVLKQVSQHVQGMITRFTPDPVEACTKAYKELGSLVRKSSTIFAGDIPDYFGAGIQEVINQLDAFRNGFARTYDQENRVSKGDSWEGWQKPETLKPVTKDMSLSEFVVFANTTIKKAAKLNELGLLSKALDALYALAADIKKAESFEDNVAASITVTIDNDPMRIVETEAPGTLAPSGTSRPDTAASNYVTNPTDVSAAAPDTGKNPSTGSLASATSSTPAGDSNFLAKSAEDIAKAEGESIQKGLEDIKGFLGNTDLDARIANTGWCNDLNSEEFLHGRRRERF